MSKESIEYLKHILQECDYIVSVINLKPAKMSFSRMRRSKGQLSAVWKLLGKQQKRSLPTLSSSGAISPGKIWQECVTV